MARDTTRMTEHLADEHLIVATDSPLDLFPAPNITIADPPKKSWNTCSSLIAFITSSTSAQTVRRTSQVCRRWRAIALNTPTLWAHIIDLESRSRWIEVVLDRARSAPLDLILPSITKDLMDESWAPTMLQKTLLFEVIDVIANPAPHVWHSCWFLFN